MKRKLSKEHTQMALLAVLLVVFFLYVLLVLVVGPLRREADHVKQALPAARERARALEFGTMNEGALREQYRQMAQQVGTLRAVLPSEDAVSSTIETLSAMADEADVKIQTIFPVRNGRAEKDKDKGGDSAVVSATVFKETLIQIDALAGYHQLGAFLSTVEASAKPMRLSSLRVSANPSEIKRHNIKVVIRAYFAPREAAL